MNSNKRETGKMKFYLRKRNLRECKRSPLLSVGSQKSLRPSGLDSPLSFDSRIQILSDTTEDLNSMSQRLNKFCLDARNPSRASCFSQIKDQKMVGEERVSPHPPSVSGKKVVTRDISYLMEPDAGKLYPKKPPELVMAFRDKNKSLFKHFPQTVGDLKERSVYMARTSSDWSEGKSTMLLKTDIFKEVPKAIKKKFCEIPISKTIYPKTETEKYDIKEEELQELGIPSSRSDTITVVLFLVIPRCKNKNNI